MNSVSLIGNLATEVELKEVATAGDDGAKKVASFLLAVDRDGREAGADFVWISTWERQAEICSEYLQKGRRVGVEGRLRTRTWEQDGQRRDAFEVVARRVEFLSSPDRQSEAEVIPFETAAIA
jgi:single-strand DNA-binding protein